MEFFDRMYEAVSALPAWCLILPPALLLAAAVVLFLGRWGKGYRYAAALCVAAGAALSAGKAWQILYLSLLAAFALLLLPLFWIPRKRKKTKEEKIYEKFRPETEEIVPVKKEFPPKVCCFEGENGETPEERGMKLSHVISLLEKLKKEKLTAADRLEVEMLSRHVTGAEHRPLTDSQTDDLSDSLSAILRLMAKYS